MPTVVFPGCALALAAALFASPPAASAAQPAGRADAVTAQAEAARAANDRPRAVALYREALRARPGWAEGWFQLGMVLYEGDQFADAADAFAQSTAARPGAGTAWAMRGLCEFTLGRHREALEHIRKGRALGTSGDEQFQRVLLYHEGLLLLGQSEFERAQETLGRLAAAGLDTEDLRVALGLSVLRVRPGDLPAGESSAREMIRRAGLAEHLAARKQLDEARKAYERLARDHAGVRHVQYALGRYFVATREPELAAAAYEREIANTPDHVPARLGIAAIKASTDPAAALRYAEQAVALNPRVPLGHYLLGSLLLHTTDTARAIAELETAEQSVKEDPGLYYALQRAYSRAGRAGDAARARATFQRLSEERQRAARSHEDTAPR